MKSPTHAKRVPGRCDVGGKALGGACTLMVWPYTVNTAVEKAGEKKGISPKNFEGAMKRKGPRGLWEGGGREGQEEKPNERKKRVGNKRKRRVLDTKKKEKTLRVTNGLPNRKKTMDAYLGARSLRWEPDVG